MNTDNFTVKELEAQIRRHNDLYWQQGKPEISDVEYDSLVRRLQQLDPENPLPDELNTPAVSSLGKVRHLAPLLSLDKAYSLEEVLEWAKKHARNDEEMLLIEPKYDGISANYSGGILATRGDGFEGENISDKIPLIELECAAYTGPLNRNVRGEIVMRPDHFARFRANSAVKYKNTRNVLTGLMTYKESKDIAQIEFLMNKHHAKLTLVDYDYISIGVTVKELAEVWNKILTDFENLPYPLDGIVIKIADKNYRSSLGSTAHHPRGEIAYKFQNGKAESTLLDVKWSFGKNCLTPVAEIAPVELNGITIRHASLHNAENIIDKDIQIGDKIIVERAGDVIPYIAEAIPGTDRHSALIDECPGCHAALERRGPELCCVNKECFETNLQRLLAAVKNIGIEELGEPTLRQMMTTLKVKTLKDVFALEQNDLLRLDGFKSKAASNLFNSIQKAKNLKDYQLLASLNIAHIGINMAKLLLKEYTLSELQTMDETELATIRGIGPERAKSLKADLTKEKDFIEELMQTLSIFETKGGAELPKICFTGKMPRERSYYEKLAKNNQYEVIDSVNQTLSLLICADRKENSTKISKAEKLKINIMELDEWLNELPEKNETSSAAFEQGSLF